MCLNYVGAAAECSTNVSIKVYIIIQGSSNLLKVISFISSAFAAIADYEILSIFLKKCNYILIGFSAGMTLSLGNISVLISVISWQDDCSDALIVSAIICLSFEYVVMALLTIYCCCVRWSKVC